LRTAVATAAAFLIIALGATTTTAAAITVAEELHVFTDDFQLVALLTVFVLPGVELETAFDIDGPSFAEVLLGQFGLFAPEGDIDKGGFFLALPIVVLKIAIDGQTDVCHGSAFGGEANLGVAGEVPDQHDFVQIGHNAAIVGARQAFEQPRILFCISPRTAHGGMPRAMTLNSTWTRILIFLVGTWTVVGMVMWWTEDQVSHPEKVLTLMQAAPWVENPNLNDGLRSAYLERVIASQNLLDFSQRRQIREEGEAILQAFFDSLSEQEQARYADGTVEHHLKKVVNILEAMSPETRKSITARLRRETGGRGEKTKSGENKPPSDPAKPAGSVEGEFDDMIGFGLEMQYRDATPAKKLEMAQMLENMQAFLQGFRR